VIEVLIALFVLSISMAAVLSALTAQVRVVESLENRAVARWAGMNVLSAMQTGILSVSAQQEGKEELLGKNWYWEAKPRQTGSSQFIQMQVSVGLDSSELTQANMVGFVPADL
jgi:general secretion pathway protein I